MTLSRGDSAVCSRPLPDLIPDDLLHVWDEHPDTGAADLGGGVRLMVGEQHREYQEGGILQRHQSLT